MGCVSVGPLRINQALRQVSLDGEPLHLSSREWALLSLLMDANGANVTFAAVAEAIHGRAVNYSDYASLRVTLHDLRRRLPLDEHGHWLIQSVRGIGLWMRAPEEEQEET